MRTKIKTDLIRELDIAYRQLKLYRNNRGLDRSHDIPKPLKDRIAYLRAYSDCIIKSEKMQRTDEDLKLAKRLQSIYGGTLNAVY